MKRSADKTTREWMRNASDKKAVANGCWFDIRRACYAVWWIERYCRLYQGDDAGQPLLLHGCHECEKSSVPGEWYLEDGSENEAVIQACIERAERYCECVRKGHRVDWQYDTVMRLFGWVRHSGQWNRAVRRFRRASIWVAKKNKKSPTLAAIGLYLTCGDGEPGQNVFLGAKDGLQAKEIAGKHAIEMLRKSPELEADCTVNLTYSQITHEPTRSILRPLSSSNSRTQQSKEGLNGSVLVDETHVVDREFIGRISRAGISRSEPLHAEFSTAGDDPEGYGQERFDHSLQVISGKVEDQALLAVVHAAPPDLGDADLDADPLKYALMANPSMGHTVDPEEFLEDYHSSRNGSLEEFGKFKMYRLNIWQKSANPWLKSSDWEACEEGYSPEDLFGRQCFGALDLSKVTDTTAFALIFPPTADDPHWRCLVFYWIPRDTAHRHKEKAPFLDWERDGHIEFAEDRWIDYAAVRAKLNWARDKFSLLCTGYDPKFSSELVQELIREDGWREDELAEYPQKDSFMAGPTEELERLIMAKQFLHPGNAVLSWQAGHVTAPQNPRTKIKRPIRPKRGDHRTIDGIVAVVMGLGLAMSDETHRPSIYETPNQLAL